MQSTECGMKYKREISMEKYIMFLVKLLICTAIYAAFQLPYCIFYTAFSYDHVHAIFVDQFFVMAAGFYTLCGGIGFLGLLVSTLLFGGIQLTGRALIFRHWDETRLQR